MSFDDFDFDPKPRHKPGTGINAPLDKNGRTALHLAIMKNDADSVAKLLRIGAKPNQPDNDGRTPIYEAIGARNTALLEMLLSCGATFRHRDEEGQTPFEHALCNGAQPEFLDYLLTLGARLEPDPDNKRTALHAAVAAGREDLIGYLVRHGIDIDHADWHGKTALHLAAELKKEAALKTLLALDANPLLRTNEIKTPLHLAAESGFAAGVALLLDRPEVRSSLNTYKTYSEGFTPLLSAIYRNHPDIVETLARAGGDVNMRDNQDRHGLFIAAEYGYLDMVRRLIRLGADVEKSPESAKNATPLAHVINSKNYSEILLTLYAAGMDLNAANGSGLTALHEACGQNDEHKIRALLDIGANPNALNEFGQRPIDVMMTHFSYNFGDKPELIAHLLLRGASPDISPAPDMQHAPLHVAAYRGYKDALLLLLKHKARIDETDRTAAGLTPFLSAAASGEREALRLLQSAGADPLRNDRYGRNALHLAARNGSKAVVEELLTATTLNIDAQDNKGRTALINACRREWPDTAAVLLQNGAQPWIFDEDGWTALHHAAEAGSRRLFEIFEQNIPPAQMDWNILSKGEKETALHIAARKGFQAPVEKLLEAGADPTIRGQHGLLPIHFAILFDHSGLANTFITHMKQQKIQLDQFRDHNDWTLLHYAATRNEPLVLSYLIAAGADINAKDANGDTPLHIAARKGNARIVDYLLNKKTASLAVANKAGETPLHVAVKHNEQATAKLIIDALQRLAGNDNARRLPRGPFRPPGMG